MSIQANDLDRYLDQELVLESVAKPGRYLCPVGELADFVGACAVFRPVASAAELDRARLRIVKNGERYELHHEGRPIGHHGWTGKFGAAGGRQQHVVPGLCGEAGTVSLHQDIDQFKQINYWRIVDEREYGGQELSDAFIRTYRVGKPAADDEAANKASSFRVRLASEIATGDQKFLIEVLGRRGLLDFGASIASQPTSASVTLYGLTRGESATTRLVEGSWADQVFTARIEDTAAMGGPGGSWVRLKFLDSGSYRFVGLLSYASYLGSFVQGQSSVLFGSSWASGQARVPAETLPASRYATIVFDRHLRARDQAYTYGWHMLPPRKQTATFQALHLAWDDLKKELALYRFEDGASLSSNEPASYEPYKLSAYKLEELAEALRGLASSVRSSDVRPALTALLFNDAMRLSPSTLLGVASGGHGQPQGIMNGILSSDVRMDACLSSVTRLRGSKLDFFDFGTNCNVASLYNLQVLARYGELVLASDLTRTNPSLIGSALSYPDDQYSTYWGDSSRSARQVLEQMMDDWKHGWLHDTTFYSDPARTEAYGGLHGLKQQLTLFRCDKLAAILAKIDAPDAFRAKVREHAALYYREGSITQADFKAAIALVYPSYTGLDADWAAFALREIDNRAAFTWDTDKPGGVLCSRR